MKYIRGIILMAIAAMAMASTVTVGSASEPRRIEIVASKYSYSPNEITLKKGEPVVLVLRSQDVPHGLKFSELNLKAEIGKGVDSQLSFTPTQVGDFVGHCSHFCGAGHGSMVLTLHVTE